MADFGPGSQLGKISKCNKSCTIRAMAMKFSGFAYLVSIYHSSKFQGNLRRKGDILKKNWMI